ncbi:MAG: N-acetylmuramoyl-L-alanine amidase [Actinomycetaceae bacterium]|nr:N-acetylmuramoyl-L-alanine amidase [Actinomycetaceae bacterium]MDY5273007.1 N-acetylmuramoyl-L-alanine amidase [Arcanobacterium sp.]
MKNWNELQADENLIMNKHYTSGRDGATINKIVLHHNAGNLSIRQCYEVWQTREASAHYQVDSTGRIGQLVHDWDTAWHAGNWAANITSIGIEHANNHIGEPWTISDATLENGAHLVAALCVYYDLGRPQWGINVFGHKAFAATGCPGEIAGSQNARYMQRAQYWYDTMAGAKTSTSPSSSSSASQSVLSIGTRGQTVSRLQAGLNKIFPAYSNLAVDGIFGQNTAAVVKEFQRRAGGLVVDGIVGANTRAALARYGITL